MKNLLPVISLFILFFSCKKEMINSQQAPASNKSHLFFQKVKSELKDSVSVTDYSNMDTARMYKSKDAQSNGCFIRIGLLRKEIATDFILLKTDTLGNIREGKIIHVDKDNLKGDKTGFGGRFAIASLNRMHTLSKRVVNGKLKSIRNTMDLQEAEEPAREQTLPDCVITCYSTDGTNEGDWYWYNGFYDDFGGGGGSYTYGYSDEGDGEFSTSTNEDKTMVVKVEPNDLDPIKAQDYLKCFNSVPDANATYQITLYADIPVNGDPSQLFNTASGEIGHSFIQLRKSSGGTIIQQNMGFIQKLAGNRYQVFLWTAKWLITPVMNLILLSLPH